MVFEAKNGFEPSLRQLFQATSLVAAELSIYPSSSPKAFLGILAKLQAQSGGYLIREIPFTPTFGEQSFPWMPAKEDHRSNFAVHDRIEQLVYGSSAYSIFRGPTGDLIQNGAEAEARSKPDGFSWTGWCSPAMVASWCLPGITGDLSLFDGSVVVPWQDRMFMGTVFCAYGLVEGEWGRLNPDSYSEIQAVHEDLINNQRPKALIADTSDFRGYPGQQWYGNIYGFDGRNVILTDFLETSELDQPKRKELVLPYNAITKVKLINPSQPQPGLENNYYYTLNRNIAKVCLGMAELVKV